MDYNYLKYLHFLFIKKNKIEINNYILCNALIFIQIISGIVMFYFNFPFSTQPIHLLLSTIIVGLQFYFLMLYNYRSNEVKI